MYNSLAAVSPFCSPLASREEGGRRKPALNWAAQAIVAPGIHCYSAEEVNARMAEGWQFMAITSELKMMLNGAAMELKKITGGLAPAGEMARY
jgi:hypothetical protein